jgi:glycosyltransferase involved in cell wall biosynthesis
VGAPVVERGLDVTFYGRDYPAHVFGGAPPHDAQRFRLLGRARPETVAELLALSDLHVYPSRPYVVSRSLVEAMARGAIVLAWDSAPVREFITDGRTGLLAAPDDAEAAERLALAALADPAAYRPLGDAAAECVRRHCSQDVVLPQLARRFDELARGGP